MPRSSLRSTSNQESLVFPEAIALKCPWQGAEKPFRPSPRAAHLGRLEIVSGGHPQTPAKGGLPQKGGRPFFTILLDYAGCSQWPALGRETLAF